MLISIPARKHHHYLLPSLPGWSLLAGIGLARLGEWLKSRPKTRHDLAWNLAVVGLAVMAFLIFGAVTGKIPGPAVYPIMLGVVFVTCIAAVTLGIEYRRGAWAMGIFCRDAGRGVG